MRNQKSEICVYTVAVNFEIKPLRIGELEIGLPVVLAPLAGYSDRAFRCLCRRMGCEYCTSEMVLDRCVTARRRKPPAILAINEADHPVGGQLIGNDPETMATGARAICAMGFDVVDLNFACPVNKAMKRSRGGRMMDEPKQVVKIVKAVVDVCDRPVTLKVRQKFADADTEENFWYLAEGARDAGAAAITVHARSVEQKYMGTADWDFLKRVKEKFPDWTVIGSGDVLSPADALRMITETGVDASAVARGVLGNPWFFRQVKELIDGREPYQPDLAEQKQILIDHMDAAEELYGPIMGPKIMRKWGIRYARMHPHPKQVRMAFVEIKKPDDWREVIEKYYGSPI